MELARQLGAAPLLVLSLSSPASPGHNPDLLPLTQDVLASLEFLTANSSSRWGAEREAQGQSQPLPLTHLVVGQDADCSQPWYAQAYQQLAAAVRASFPHLQLLACADLGPLPVMDGWELQAQLDPDTTARLGEALDAYQVTMVSSQGLLLPAQNPSQPWGKHHSLVVYSATHQPLETPAAQLHHLLRQHQGSLCAKDWQLLSSPADRGQVESSASCNDAACTHLILKLVNQGHMKQAVTVTVQHTVPPPAPSWWSQTPRVPRLLLAGSEATTWAVKGPDDAGPTFEHPSNQLFQAQPAQLTVVPTVSDNTHVSLIVQLLPHSFTVAHLHLAQEPHDPVP
ncbi:alpha-L-arabinofuranosidase 1 isoform A [Haematococcus lacustris]|uniref:Alpha-L-arabinofuranosidase 1 isoform A n=1 Tax=Haematococcus lacustris TaxID=44745 RepID=A0A699Z7W2_HAELA|nr:alpha-L-arabinofuranosidase 1 isoform A [Haematococcus lacustris]